VIRECEVYRNAYEVRSRYQRHDRGKKRKQWWLDSKYSSKSVVQMEEGEEDVVGIEKTRSVVDARRKELKSGEAKDLEARYEKKKGG